MTYSSIRGTVLMALEVFAVVSHISIVFLVAEHVLNGISKLN
jgi:hypothetical protein